MFLTLYYSFFSSLITSLIIFLLDLILSIICVISFMTLIINILTSFNILILILIIKFSDLFFLIILITILSLKISEMIDNNYIINFNLSFFSTLVLWVNIIVNNIKFIVIDAELDIREIYKDLIIFVLSIIFTISIQNFLNWII